MLIVDLHHIEISEDTFFTVVLVRIWRIHETLPVLSGKSVDLISHDHENLTEASLVSYISFLSSKILNSELIDKILESGSSVNVGSELLVPELPFNQLSHTVRTSIPTESTQTLFN